MIALLFRRRWIATAGCCLLLVVYAVPLAWILLESLASDRVAGAGFPTEFSVEAYERVLGGVGGPIAQSAIIAVATALLVVVLSALAGYGLSHVRGRLGSVVIAATMIILVVVQMIPQATNAIPLYGLFGAWGLVNSTVGVVLADVALLLPLGIVLVRPFFVEVPVELEQAAMIDGANRWKVVWHIVLPLARNGLVTVGLLSFMIAWGEFIYAITFLNDSGLFPVSVILAQQVGSLNASWNSLMALAVLTSIPLVVIFIGGQRRLQAGMMAGAVK
ncbi:carbohydrate ABC transporter permease [Leifsonia sp. ZF2019]|uniref:carbohydrate ABC transporter permease n=1 Tax=Leifsonia sp. ZF2019 TaxID=2781978 RepID=UPI001CBBACA2|nr:carbohydrate ABC transporter permease [Leifsonia sp. ZF2019]UAJ79222.1 carbohydrate ABC transporter permease [Leifsonia sp. ZF2019]